VCKYFTSHVYSRRISIPLNIRSYGKAGKLKIIRELSELCAIIRSETFTCAKLPFPSFSPASYLKTILHYVQSFTHKSYRSASSVTISVSITVDRNGGFFHIHARTNFFSFFLYKAVNIKRSLTMFRTNIYSRYITYWGIK
jgi:hypothetical protein